MSNNGAPNPSLPIGVPSIQFQTQSDPNERETEELHAYSNRSMNPDNGYLMGLNSQQSDSEPPEESGHRRRKRPRRKFSEIERIYICHYRGCLKAYGTLNHLNAHVLTQNHGGRRRPEQYKDLRKRWKEQKKRNSLEAARQRREQEYRRLYGPEIPAETNQHGDVTNDGYKIYQNYSSYGDISPQSNLVGFNPKNTSYMSNLAPAGYSSSMISSNSNDRSSNSISNLISNPLSHLHSDGHEPLSSSITGSGIQMQSIPPAADQREYNIYNTSNYPASSPLFSTSQSSLSYNNNYTIPNVNPSAATSITRPSSISASNPFFFAPQLNDITDSSINNIQNPTTTYSPISSSVLSTAAAMNTLGSNTNHQQLSGSSISSLLGLQNHNHSNFTYPYTRNTTEATTVESTYVNPLGNTNNNNLSISNESGFQPSYQNYSYPS